MINPAKPEIKAARPRTYTTLWDTIHACLTRARLANAKRLLRGGDMPIRDVARAGGFARPNRFATSFRKHPGTTPPASRPASPAARHRQRRAPRR
jgi:transcriptional regulator GlxA family with amidase domain